jgi:hypothetical protein
MQIWKYVAGTTIAAGLIFGTVNSSPAQISVQIGPAPSCPYGYYEEPPYNCAPDGYYGPEWYNGGVFIGAGPWFHGGDHFYGHVDHHLDYRQGYRGGFPARGEQPHPNRAQFHGEAMHDSHGHEAPHGGHR